MKKNNLQQYSVLMCVYYKDNADWLKVAIESMLNQTIKTNDFVIVEDGILPNELKNVIEHYKKKNKDLFNIVEIKRNGGLGPALSLGVTKCKNELIARMDSDDYSVPNRCEKQIELFNNNDKLDIVGSNIAEFVGNINNIQAYRVLPENDKEIKKFARRRNPFRSPIGDV